MKKKIALLSALLLILTLLLAGCGGTAVSPSPSASDNAAASPTSAATPTASDYPAVTLKYLTWDYSDRTASTDAWIADMKSMYNITIDMQNVPSDQYPAIFKTHVSANDMPDLVAVHGVFSGTDGNYIVEDGPVPSNTFVDLSTLGLSSIADYVPSILDFLKVDGAQYYVPVYTSALGVLYNKQIFSDNNLQIPTDVNSFLAICDQLKAKGITPIAQGAQDNWATQIIPFIAFSQYIDGPTPDTKAQLVAGTQTYAGIGQPFKDALSLQQTWAQDGYYQPSYMGTSIDVASSLVGTGKAAMLICGTWEESAILTANPDAQIGFFPLPLNQSGEKIELPTSSGSGICISSSTKYMDACKLALDYYLSPANQTRVIQDIASISTNTKVTVSNPFIQDVQNAMSDPNCHVQPEWWSVGSYFPTGATFNIGLETQSLLAGGTTVDQFISDVDAAGAQALASAGASPAS